MAMLTPLATHGSARHTWQPRRVPPATPLTANRTSPRTWGAAHSRARRPPPAPHLPPTLARRDDTDPLSSPTPLTPLLRPRAHPRLAAPATSETVVGRAAAKDSTFSRAPHPVVSIHRLLNMWLRPWLKRALGWLQRRWWWWGRSPADDATRAELHAKLVRLTDRTRRSCFAEVRSCRWCLGRAVGART